MEIFIKNDDVERQIMAKKISKISAINSMTKMVEHEAKNSTDPFWKTRVDWVQAQKNHKKYADNLSKVSPEKLSASVKDRMWRRAKQLKDEFSVGMLSQEELHPVKGFKHGDSTAWVVDDEKLRSLKSIDRNNSWYKKNSAKLLEYKNIMRHLCPDDSRASDIEKFRPKLTGIR